MTIILHHDLLHPVVYLVLLGALQHSAAKLVDLDDLVEAVEVVEVDCAGEGVATILQVLVLVLIEHDHSHFGAI